MTPDLLDRSLCAALIQRFETMGSVDSGFMREVDGKTLGLHDPRHKRRRDHIITDTALIRSLKAAFAKRLTPLVERAFQFKATRMERYIVACYDAEGGAHFRAHRDNTTAGTAHRRFAVSVNLNDDFDGGEVSFPEFGPKSYKPPPGAALVFSCSLLHAVSPMRRGKRYAFLPFLYDEEAARLREANNIHLGDNVSAYDSGQSNQNPLPSENNQQ
jgi:predicted 2-oxoglutarate/Fe(II)-dependent dioxygenase YbiX